jgi:large subunit ribosomal protein L47
MASLHTSRMLRPSLAAAQSDAFCLLRAPAARCARSFSTSPALCKKDNNSNRGLSAVKATGVRPRQTLSVKQKDYENQKLPRPVEVKDQVTGTPDHGLWGFFKDKKLLQPPIEEASYGREWTVGELRSRDWDTLHQLWWVCVKERNRLATEKLERARIKAGYGDIETTKRDEVVQKTMKAILDTLAERHQAYQEAYELARRDPAIDLTRTDGPQYTQLHYVCILHGTSARRATLT